MTFSACVSDALLCVCVVWCVCESLCVCFDARICYENWIRLAKRTSSSWYDCICLPACLSASCCCTLHVACCMWHAPDSIPKFLWHAIWLTAARCINYVKLFNRIKAGAVHDRDWITEGLNYIYVHICRLYRLQLLVISWEIVNSYGNIRIIMKFAYNINNDQIELIC